jgi:thioredoxin reductase
MHYDAIIIGGSFAGLSAAIYLARARRSVLVIDAGKPRNRFAAQSHGLFAQDGSSPGAMIKTAREQVSAYPTVSFVDGVAADAWKEDGRLVVALEDGAVHSSARLLLAFGVSDVLPKITGLAERWGQSVIHCPYCHGYEFSERRLGVLQLSPVSQHQALLISEWGPTTFFLNGGAAPDDAVLEQFKKRGIVIESRPIGALVGPGADLSHVQLSDGATLALDALYIGPRQYLTSPIAEQMGCKLNEGPFGPSIAVDDMKMTSVPDVYAAGDITKGGGHTVTFASADGVTAGLAIHRSLAFGAS